MVLVAIAPLQRVSEYQAGKDRVDATCRRALRAGICSHKGVRSILDAKLDQVEPELIQPLLDKLTRLRLGRCV